MTDDTIARPPRPALTHPQSVKPPRIGLFLFLTLVGAAATVATFLHTFAPSSALNSSLSTLPLLAHGFAFALPLGAGLVAFTAVVMIIVFVRRRGAWARPTLWGLVPALTALSGTFLVLSATPIALPAPLTSDAKSGPSDLVVVSWNALDHLDDNATDTIFNRLGADVAVLPELGSAASGLDPDVYDVFESPHTGTAIEPVTVVVRKGLGVYRSVDIAQTTFGTVHLVPTEDSDLPDIIAVHTAPPLPGLMGAWRDDLTLVRQFTALNDGDVVLAGDLNATMRHGDLGAISTHADVLSASTEMASGTWPQTLPHALRSRIDHVLIPRNAYTVDDVAIVDIAGSDHAAIATSLSRTD